MKPVAMMMVHAIGRMSKGERDDIVRWLRITAKNIAKSGHLYTHGIFRAHYMPLTGKTAAKKKAKCR